MFDRWLASEALAHLFQEVRSIVVEEERRSASWIGLVQFGLLDSFSEIFQGFGLFPLGGRGPVGVGGVNGGDGNGVLRKGGIGFAILFDEILTFRGSPLARRRRLAGHRG